MKKLPKVLKEQMPEALAGKVMSFLADNEKEVYKEKEINDWRGLSRGERAILIGIRKHMRERTSLKGSKGWTSATHEDIGKWGGFSEKHAARLIKGLESKKVLTITGKGKKTFPGSKKGYAIQKRGCCFREESMKERLARNPVARFRERMKGRKHARRSWPDTMGQES